MNIKEDVKNAFVNNKYILLISAIVFLATLFIGYIFNESLYSFLNPSVELLKKGVENGSINLSFVSLFSNNVEIVFRMFIYGIIFCISNFLLGFNGLFLGFFIGQSNNLIYTIMLILPHGIFELSSVVIANAAGMVLFKHLFKVVTFKNPKSEKEDSVFNKLSNSVVNNSDVLKEALILLVVAVILMAIAGVIEAYFTKGIASFVMNLIG